MLAILGLLFSALTLAPLMAHLLEMQAKMGLSRADYQTAQQLYAGWDALGFVIVGALLSTLAYAWAVRSHLHQALLALLSFGCLLGTQVLFWTWTYPANQATRNWTSLPADWMELRLQWESSHAASAGLALLALITLILAVVEQRPRPAGSLTSAPPAWDSAWMEYASPASS